MNYHQWYDKNITFEEWMNLLEHSSDHYNPFRSKAYECIRSLDTEKSKKQLLKLAEIGKEMTLLQYIEIERNQNEVIQKMKQIGVEIYENPYTKKQLMDQWKESFLSSLTDKDIEECYIDSFLWHAFTYQKISWDCCGSDACKKFDSQKKTDLYVFWQNRENVYLLNNCESLDSRYFRFELFADCYITDVNFEWTYIMPHEVVTPIWYQHKRNE